MWLFKALPTLLPQVQGALSEALGVILLRSFMLLLSPLPRQVIILGVPIYSTCLSQFLLRLKSVTSKSKFLGGEGGPGGGSTSSGVIQPQEVCCLGPALTVGLEIQGKAFSGVLPRTPVTFWA